MYVKCIIENFKYKINQNIYFLSQVQKIGHLELTNYLLYLLNYFGSQQFISGM